LRCRNIALKKVAICHEADHSAGNYLLVNAGDAANDSSIANVASHHETSGFP
jgi:hypothetical protein